MPLPRPSDVVVMENVIRPDTVGRIEPVLAKYELLPRGQYTLTVNPGQLRTVEPEQEKLPYDRYEAVLELYQAQNAIQIARSVGADQYAADTISKADGSLADAQDMEARKQDTHMIVSRAREAAQMAEDARTIAHQAQNEERVSGEREQQLEEGRASERAEKQAAAGLKRKLIAARAGSRCRQPCRLSGTGPGPSRTVGNAARATSPDSSPTRTGGRPATHRLTAPSPRRITGAIEWRLSSQRHAARFGGHAAGFLFEAGVTLGETPPNGWTDGQHALADGRSDGLRGRIHR